MIVAAKLHFHEFEFDPKRLELRKHGHRVRVPASQLRLLSLFLERPGELITREDIVARLWTETGTIDVVSGVNTAINRLRFHLGDNADTPRFLETVIGLGYRFIAPVEEIHADAPAPLLEPPSRPPETPRRQTPWKFLLWSAVAALVLVAVALRSTTHHQTQRPNSAPRPLALVQATFNRGGDQVLASAISPDGTLLAYADSAGIRVQALSTKQETSLPSLPTFAVNHISWFPKQRELAVSGTDLTTHRDLVWVVPISGISTVPLATDAELATVSPSGQAIALFRSHRSEVWLTDSDGTNPHRLSTAPAQGEFSFALWSLDNRHLLLAGHDVSSANTSHPGHWFYESLDVSSGKTLAREENVAIESAALLPSGELRYVSAASPTHGHLFSVQTDIATGRFLTSPIEVELTETYALANLSYSADGSKLSVIEQKVSVDSFTASLRRRPDGLPIALDDIRRLSSALSDAYPHAWLDDGRIIYETPELQSHIALFSQRIGEALPTLFAEPPVDTIMAQFSPSRQSLLFQGLESHSPAANAIYHMPLSGGQPQPIPGTTGDDEFRCARALIGPIACVMRRTRDNQERLYFALDPFTGVGRLLARTPWQPSRRGDWGLSPDGTTVVVANRDANNPALNFLKLNGSSVYEKSLPIRGHGSPLGAGWSVDGKYLFVETRAAEGLELLSVTLDGHTQLLHKSAAVIWAIPSPDGKQIAFPGLTDNANVWVNKR